MSATNERYSAATLHAAMAGIVADAARARPLILVADDLPQAAAAVAVALRHHGMQVVLAQDVFEVFAALQAEPVSAMLMSHALGPIDAVALLPQLRRATGAPILVQSPQTTEADRILALELGADDVLMRGVSGRELVARLRAALRRPHRFALPPLVTPPAVQDAAETRPWRLAHAERRLYRPDGSMVRLTSAEFDLLATLAERPGEIHSRDALTRAVFRRPWRANDRAIDNVVVRLRAKLGADLGEGCIVTARQRGYAFAGFSN
jgi:DNA-binding response OmpR family regulator